MTGLEKIIEQIRLDAQESASHQITKAEQEAQALLAQAQEQGALTAAKYEQQAKSRQADIKSRGESAATLESRKLLLCAKQQLIGQALTAAQEKLHALPDAAYFDTLAKLASKTATGEQGQLQLNATDLARLPADFTSKLPTGITLSTQAAPIKNGFLLLYGGIDLNCSFEALFAAHAEALQDKAASILFA